MSFVFPAAFFLTALGAGILALYLQRQRRRPLEVSTLLFWQRILEREPHRRFLGRLRHPLSLLIQLLILLALVLALARPKPGARPHAAHTVVVLDTRTRMQAEGVFPAAVQAAQGLAAHASANTPLALLAVNGGPEILSGFSGDPRHLRETLAAVQPTDASGGLEETLALAERLLASQSGDRRLVFLSDRPADTTAEQVLTGRAADNAGILAFSQRPIPSSPQSAEVFVKIGNFASTDRDLELELSLDGRLFDLQTFRVPAGGEKDYSLTIPAAIRASGPGHLVAKLTTRGAADALHADDSACAQLDTGAVPRVLLLTESNPFLQGALRADPGVQLEILNPTNWRPDLVRGFDAVVFDRFLPDDLDLNAGRYFFFGQSPFEIGGEEVTLSAPTIADPSSPLLWNVGTIGPVRARLLRAPEGWRTEAPVTGGGAPLILTVEKPGGPRHVATAFSVEDTTFPLRPGFPLFVSNVIRWLTGHDQAPPPPLRAGQTFLPENGEQIARRPNDPTASDFSNAPVRLVSNGFYAVRHEGATRWVAVNTASAEESDLRTASSTQGPLVNALPGGLLPWQILAALALGLLLLEWWLHQRRITE